MLASYFCSMMLKQLLLGLLLVCSGLAVANGPGHSASTAVIEGKVLDISNAEALTGATIFIKELDLKVFASFDGSFEFPAIPEGTYTFEVSFVSYDKVVYEDMEVKAGKAFKKFYLRGV